MGIHLSFATALKSHFTRSQSQEHISIPPLKRILMKILYIRDEKTIRYRFFGVLPASEDKMPQISFSAHTILASAKRYMWITDAWSHSFSRQWKFNLTLIRLLSHKCHITCAKPRVSRSSFSMGKLQEVQKFYWTETRAQESESLKSIFNSFLLLLTQNFALASGDSIECQICSLFAWWCFYWHVSTHNWQSRRAFMKTAPSVCCWRSETIWMNIRRRATA